MTAATCPHCGALLEPEQPAAGVTAPDALAVVPVEVMVDLEPFEDENGFVDAEAWFRERDRVWAEARLKEIGKAGVGADSPG